MTQQVHRRRTGDTITVLPVTIMRPDSTGVATAVNLTGLTVKFRMVNAATGVEKVAETTATVVTAASGTVNYDFSSSDVDTAGIFDAWFVVYSGSETDTFPVRKHGLQVYIDSDTETAEEAYEAALMA